jgi:hypothetical protein
MAWGYVPPLVLEAAIHHRIFDTLDSGPKTVSELQRSTGASARGLTAIVNVLVGLGFLSKDAHGRFALTPESETFLVSTKPGFQGGIIRHGSEHLTGRRRSPRLADAPGRPVRIRQFCWLRRFCHRAGRRRPRLRVRPRLRPRPRVAPSRRR